MVQGRPPTGVATRRESVGLNDFVGKVGVIGPLLVECDLELADGAVRGKDRCQVHLCKQKERMCDVRQSGQIGYRVDSVGRKRKSGADKGGATSLLVVSVSN